MRIMPHISAMERRRIVEDAMKNAEKIAEKIAAACLPVSTYVARELGLANAS